jgi:hypothetical protein
MIKNYVGNTAPSPLCRMQTVGGEYDYSNLITTRHCARRGFLRRPWHLARFQLYIHHVETFNSAVMVILVTQSTQPISSALD